MIANNPDPPGQAAVDRGRRRRADPSVRRLQRGRRGALRGRAHPQRGRTRQRREPVPSCTAPRPSRGCSKRPCCRPASRTACTAACDSSSAPRSRMRWPTCAWYRTATTTRRSRRAVNQPPRGIGPAHADAVRAHARDFSVPVAVAGGRWPAALAVRCPRAPQLHCAVSRPDRERSMPTAPTRPRKRADFVIEASHLGAFRKSRDGRGRDRIETWKNWSTPVASSSSPM